MSSSTYVLLVQRWVCYEELVELNAHTDREARETALREAKLERGMITKNRTTVLAKDDVKLCDALPDRQLPFTSLIPAKNSDPACTCSHQPAELGEHEPKCPRRVAILRAGRKILEER